MNIAHIIEKRVITAQLLQVADTMLFLAKEKVKLEKIIYCHGLLMTMARCQQAIFAVVKNFLKV